MPVPCALTPVEGRESLRAPKPARLRRSLAGSSSVGSATLSAVSAEAVGARAGGGGGTILGARGIHISGE